MYFKFIKKILILYSILNNITFLKIYIYLFYHDFKEVFTDFQTLLIN
jgi:hypothetical protein